MEPEIVGNRIKELMKKQNITADVLAKKMNIDIKKLNKKLEGKEEFYIEEMRKIKDIFNLDVETADKIFFKEDCKI